MFPDFDVVLLWGFIDPRWVDTVIIACSHHNIAFDRPDAERVPTWTSEIPGRHFLLDTVQGEYGGALGLERMTELKEQGRARVESRFRRKHPNWSASRINRAVEQNLKNSTTISAHARTVRYKAVSRMIAFIKEVAHSAPLTLLLDDGGTISSNMGGTHDLPERRLPKLESACAYDVADIDEDILLQFPYWIPVNFCEDTERCDTAK